MPASNHKPHQGTIKMQRIKIIKKEKQKQNLRLKEKGKRPSYLSACSASLAK